MVHCLFRVLEQSTACTNADHKTTGPSLCFYVIICTLIELVLCPGEYITTVDSQKTCDWADKSKIHR